MNNQIHVERRRDPNYTFADVKPGEVFEFKTLPNTHMKTRYEKNDIDNTDLFFVKASPEGMPPAFEMALCLRDGCMWHVTDVSVKVRVASKVTISADYKGRLEG